MTEPDTAPGDEGSAPGGRGRERARRRVLNRRGAARFAAVQALYQLEVGGAPLDIVLGEFHAHRLADLLEPLELDADPQAVDRQWFQTVTTGAWTRTSELDPVIGAQLAPGWTLARAGYLLRAFLRAGAFELAHCPDVPPRVVVSEYVDLAHGFLTADDAGFVNAVLDRLVAALRAAPSADHPVTTPETHSGTGAEAGPETVAEPETAAEPSPAG